MRFVHFNIDFNNKTIKHFGFGYFAGAYLYHSIDEEENTTLSPVTIKELFKTLENQHIGSINTNNIPIKIIVKTSRGKEIIYLYGVKVEIYGKIIPWGWHRIQNLVVEKISQINLDADYKLTIVARED